MKLSVNLNDKFYVLTHESDGDVKVLNLGPFPIKRNVGTAKVNAAKAKPSKAKLNDPSALLVEINGYFAQMSKERQDELFNLYSSAVDVITSEMITYEILGRLKSLFAVIMDNYYDLDAVGEYVHGLNIEYPDTVLDEYVSDNNRKIRACTYIKSEYFGLACIALICHGMAPLWTLLGSLLPSSDRDNVSARDSTVLSTLTKTKFINDVDWVGRLYDMLIHLVENFEEKQKLSIKVGGSGSEGIPPFILASVLIHKLPTCSIAKSHGKNLVVVVYHSVKQEIGRYSSSRERVLERSDKRISDEEDKIGYLEAYSTRQKVSDDIYIVNEIYLTNLRQVTTDLDDSIPYSLVKTCLASLQKSHLTSINKTQVVLCQWVLPRSVRVDPNSTDGKRAQLIMPLALEFINREGIICAMAVTQAALITWGFKSLAKYISAVPYSKSREELLTICGPLALEISPELKERLKVTHPYLRPQGARMAPAVNMAETSINEYILLLENLDWKLECTAEVANALDCELGYFEVDQYIKHDLANLIEFIAK